ncbi:MAG: PAS domain S-box protein [Nitrospirales bacterium]|nr:PAS domain S-box protein [Nitrospira sp.]MDR4500049.1 PAS domain S-box protein [Nitrospirales bacterium]
MPGRDFSSSAIGGKSIFPVHHQSVYVQQVDQLYANAPIGIIGSFVNACVLGFMQWNVVPHTSIVIWLVCVFLVNIFGIILLYQYQTHKKTSSRPAFRPTFWDSWFITRMVVVGLVWGALPVFLYPQDSIPHQIFLALIVGGMVAGATAAHAASIEAFLAYSLPATLPLIVRFFAGGSHFHIAMGAVGIFFLIMMIVTMLRNHKVLISAIGLQSENSSLIAHLSEERDRAESLNQALLEEVNMCQRMEQELIRHRDDLEQIVKERTEELHTSETRFQFLAENITDLLWMMDLDGRHFRYMSPSVEQMLGYSLEEVPTISLEDVLTEGSLDRARSVMKEELAAEQDPLVNLSRSRTLELEHRRKDGSVFWAEIQARFYRDEQGGTIGIVGVTRDVTERKRVETTRRRLDVQLLRSQKMEAIGTLAGGIAHDFNNLLTGVLGNISLAKGFFTEGSPGAQYLHVAEHEGNRAKDLTQQLLTFAKGGDPIKRVTSLDVLVKNTVEFVLSGSPIARKYEYEEPLWLVEVDAGQISQAIQSIVTNAVESMTSKGLLTIRWENHAMNEPSAELGGSTIGEGYVKVSFTDVGSGIASEDLPKIFDPYFTTKSDGHGLGLTSAYTIMKKHHGHLTAESTPGRGTCISLYLPACPKGTMRRPLLPHTKKHGTGKVLVMDDEESIRVLASEMLRSCGYHFAMAKNGEEALSLYQDAQKANDPFSAVILDLTVPGGLGGKETMQRLLQIDPEVKAVVSSGYSNDPIMAQYQAFGFQAVMTKPYSLLELSDVMYRLVMDSFRS